MNDEYYEGLSESFKLRLMELEIEDLEGLLNLYEESVLNGDGEKFNSVKPPKAVIEYLENEFKARKLDESESNESDEKTDEKTDENSEQDGEATESTDKADESEQNTESSDETDNKSGENGCNGKVIEFKFEAAKSSLFPNQDYQITLNDTVKAGLLKNSGQLIYLQQTKLEEVEFPEGQEIDGHQRFKFLYNGMHSVASLPKEDYLCLKRYSNQLSTPGGNAVNSMTGNLNSRQSFGTTAKPCTNCG